MKVLISLCTLLLVSVFPACFGASVQCAVTPPQNVRNTMIVTVDWLAKHLNDSSLVLLHVGEKTEFEKEHIPGAIYISVSDISLSQAETPLTLQLPPAERLKETFEKMGVGDNSRIIVYFGKDWVTPTTRVYFTLDYLGLGDQTSILDGGLPAWKAAGQSVTAEVKSPVRATLTPHPNPDLVASLDWVKSHLNKPDTALIDARVSRFYEGRDPGAMPRAGRIPGATNIPYPSLTYEADLKFKDPATLATMLRQAGVDQGDTVSYTTFQSIKD
nr:rhodanese-like domain-containing protein [Acidobacteriota bacterium]